MERVIPLGDRQRRLAVFCVSRLWRICTAFAFNEMTGKLKADILLVAAIFAVKKQCESEPAHLFFWNINRSKHRGCFL